MESNLTKNHKAQHLWKPKQKSEISKKNRRDIDIDEILVPLVSLPPSNDSLDIAKYK